MKFLILFALVGATSAFVECRTPTNAELFNSCVLDVQINNCKSFCRTTCAKTTANLSVCIKKNGGKDFDCVCATQAGRGPGIP
ncbi:hypothetical protein Cob_v009794 [Colletotrichum orbiculare MAFF 240422]|uniref:Uncharacterized protein n=1 Tax=Colletotrichum orbiculare (strain 104-T / ATCC 96160 / CBS 514.97 / LARS 414 / MAFF 240422) TaxID=1213857 RepID=A0A484FI04_COLOR|nr:hypothetical protein Cob_v009794 [Colletotrichum orbiculare MAFF 240422]